MLSARDVPSTSDLLSSRGHMDSPAQDSAFALQLPEWMPEAAFWLSVAALLGVLAVAVGVWTLVSRLRELRAESRSLAVLEELDRKLGRFIAGREDLDLRRLEHLLVDLRDGQKRVEDALLRTLESGRTGTTSTSDLVLPTAPETVAERVTNRLHALGYERVQIVTRTEKLLELVSRDGEVAIEAHREGVLYKGRVLLRSGRIADVEVHPTYSIFP